ncbi:MAG: hydrogenase, partial [Alphaproteobacteria bacterium]|nr:hydrogenase [Alphaproteobacteria bacterium]
MLRLLAQALLRGPVTEKAPDADPDGLADLARRVRGAAQARLGRSLAIRAVDAGSCNGCELEIHALNNPVYD